MNILFKFYDIFVIPEKHADRAAISVDGRTAVTAFTLSTGQEGARTGDILRLWDVAAGAELPLFQNHEADIAALAFSPNGVLLASGGLSKAAELM